MIDTEKIIKQIETDGYARIQGVYDLSMVNKLITLCKEFFENSENKISKDVPFLNRDQSTIYNLQNKNFFFVEALFYSHELETILKHFLNDIWYKQIPQNEPNYILRSFGARSSHKGLPLHIDSFIPYIGDNVIAMQYAIVLEDQTIENGCTTVIPGTHKSGKYADNNGTVKAIPIESKTGDVVIWDSRLWHGTTDNNSKGT
ncbi:MAG TPA: phytanoyl-CoA dioxygenase family protein, partial [Puia sp.]|nr:phytanoyl-CoA dioxygenase family protein [Puia sp.]